jgi:hypothetical protein
MTHQWICILSEDVENALLVATLYGIYTKALTQPVKRRPRRAPREVVLQFTLERPGTLKPKRPRSQNGTSKKPRGKSLKCDGQWKIVLQQS